MLQWLYTYVSSVCSKHLFQTYVVNISSGCCKSRSRMFHVFQVFHTYIASVSSACCICLQCLHACFLVFHTYIASVSLFRTYVASVSSGCCTCCNVTPLPQPPTATARTPPWVTVRAPKTGRCICGAHPQAGQETRTHEGTGGPPRAHGKWSKRGRSPHACARETKRCMWSPCEMELLGTHRRAIGAGVASLSHAGAN